MSFTRETKEELARVWPLSACCRLAELAGLARAGSLEIGGGLLRLSIPTEHAAVARKALHLAKDVWRAHPEVRVWRRVRLRRGRRFQVRVPLLRESAERLGLLPGGAGASESLGALLRRRCCQRAFVRGLFLGAGSVNSPTADHHLELVLREAELADAVGQILFAASIPARVTARKDSVLVYLKDAQAIADFLGLVGASSALLRFEDARAFREMKGQIQRLVNAETANLSKTVDAGLRQRALIEALARERGLDWLPPPLQEIARLRLAHPEASLAELGRLCRPPVGKSGVNHRLRRVLQIAQGLTNLPSNPFIS